MKASLGALTVAYVDRQRPEALIALHIAVLGSRTFERALAPYAIARPFLDRGDHAGLVADLQRRMPGAFFSPGVHRLMSRSLRALSHARGADREEALARAALSSILDSGDGSRDRPWRVLRTSDEYDVLAERGRRSVEQSVVVEGGRRLDRHRLDDDDRDVWFSVPQRA